MEKFKPQPPSQNFLNQRHELAQVSWNLIEKKYGKDVVDEKSMQNLEEANRFLEIGSLVVYVNHQKISDTPLILSLIFKYLTNAQNLIGPAGMKHFDFSRDPINATFLQLLRLIHVYTLPIVQHNDDKKHQYDEKDKALMTNTLRAISAQILNQPGMIYGIAPEGTRNKDGALTEGRFGLGRLRLIHDKESVKYLPVGLIYPSATDNNLRVKVGRATFWHEIVNPQSLPSGEDNGSLKQANKIVTDGLMLNLAQLLPKNMRGYYDFLS